MLIGKAIGKCWMDGWDCMNIHSGNIPSGIRTMERSTIFNGSLHYSQPLSTPIKPLQSNHLSTIFFDHLGKVGHNSPT